MEFIYYLKEFITNDKYMELSNFMAHGSTTLLNHSINLSFLCYKHAIKKNKYD